MFIVEDGSIVTNANSYTTVDFADSYFTDKLISLWTNLTEDQKKARLIVASQYVDVKWGSQLKGHVLNKDQPLLFPRDVFYIITQDQSTQEQVTTFIIPKVLQQAVCEYALNVDEETMSLTTVFGTTEQGGELKRKKEEVGAIKTEYEFFASESSGNVDLFSHYVLADSLMSSLLKVRQYKCIRN